DPAWTDYRKRALYSAYEVGSLLRVGRNVILVRLGQGHAAQPALLLQLQMGEQLIVSGPAWRARNGALRSDSLYDGEVCDAREESNDGGWTAAKLAPVPPAAVSAQMIPPMEVTQSLVPLQVSQPAPGVKVADYGQLLSGWVRIRMRGERGATV